MQGRGDPLKSVVMDYRVVYDISQCGYDWTFAAFGLLFVIVGLVVCTATFRKGAQTSLWQQAYAIFLLLFSILWTVVVFFATLLPYLSARSACEGGRCAVVEGRVEQFKATPSLGPDQKDEGFVVQGVEFKYSDYLVKPGFRRMSSHGGPIREGLQVRIHYANGQILKLEVADSEAASVAEGTPYCESIPGPLWVLAFMVPGWLLVSAVISVLGGWRALADRYPGADPAAGRTFAMQSVSFSLFGSYSGCVEVTVGDAGISMIPILLFRFMHPRVTIPWADVRSCDRKSGWFKLGWFSRTAVTLIDGRTLTFHGAAGKAILGQWRRTHGDVGYEERRR